MQFCVGGGYQNTRKENTGHPAIGLEGRDRAERFADGEAGARVGLNPETYATACMGDAP